MTKTLTAAVIGLLAVTMLTVLPTTNADVIGCKAAVQKLRDALGDNPAPVAEALEGVQHHCDTLTYQEILDQIGTYTNTATWIVDHAAGGTIDSVGSITSDECYAVGTVDLQCASAHATSGGYATPGECGLVPTSTEKCFEVSGWGYGDMKNYPNNGSLKVTMNGHVDTCVIPANPVGNSSCSTPNRTQATKVHTVTCNQVTAETTAWTLTSAQAIRGCA